MGVNCSYCIEKPALKDLTIEEAEGKTLSELTEENYSNIPKLIENFEHEAVFKQEMTRRRGLVGIANMTNTCYLSAAIQCLSHSMQLTEYILSNQWKSEINTINRIGSGGKFLLEFCKMIHLLWKENPENYVSPKNFRYEVEAKNDMVSYTN